MNPVIGLIVSKGESHAQDLESFTGKRPAVVLEATGHYHSSVVQFLDKYRINEKSRVFRGLHSDNVLVNRQLGRCVSPCD